MKIRSFPLGWSLIAVLCLVVILLVARGGVQHKPPSAELTAMLESVVPNSQLTTANETRRSVQDYEKVFGKPIYPDVIIYYEPKEGYTENDVSDEIVSLLTSAGWHLEEIRPELPEFRHATLSQGKITLSAAVSLDSDRGIVSVLLKSQRKPYSGNP